MKPTHKSKMNEKLINVAFAFQKKHPDYVGGKRIVGRINLSKRWNTYFLLQGKIMCGNKSRIPNILTNKKMSFGEKVKKIAETTVTETGSTGKAIKYLERIIKKNKQSNEHNSENQLKKLVKRDKLAKEKFNYFSDSIEHSIQLNPSVIIQYVILAKQYLEKNKRAMKISNWPIN